MKKLLGAVSVAALLTTPGFAETQLFSFESGVFTDGGILSGSFLAEDLDGDFQISSFNGEVSNFEADYIVNDSVFTSFEFSSLSGEPEVNDGPGGFGGLVFTLDGTGQLGDDSYRDIEGLSIFNGQFSIDIGPGPFGEVCGAADGACGAIFEGLRFGGGDPVGPPPVFEVFSDDNEVFNVRTERDGGGDIGPVIIAPPQNDALELAVTFESLTVTADDLGSEIGVEGRPFFPNFESDEGFEFTVPNVDPGEIFFIDPVIAVGYTYVADGNAFTSVQAPSLATVPDSDGEYLLTVNGITATLLAGGIIDFAALPGLVGPVTEFTITGIDTGLELDPDNPLAFQTGIAVANSGVGFVTQTPITIDTDLSAIPLPAGSLLMLTGIGGLVAMRRRRRNG